MHNLSHTGRVLLVLAVLVVLATAIALIVLYSGGGHSSGVGY